MNDKHEESAWGCPLLIASTYVNVTTTHEHFCACTRVRFLQPSNVAVWLPTVFNKGPADKQDVSNKHCSHATVRSITLRAGFRALITLITIISTDDDDVGGVCEGPVSQECLEPFLSLILLLPLK